MMINSWSTYFIVSAKKDHYVYTGLLSIRKHDILLSYVHGGLCNSF